MTTLELITQSPPYKFKSLGGTVYGKFGRADYQGCLFMKNK